MSEIILQINDDIDFDRIISLLAPYIAKAEIKNSDKKKWTGKAEWLDTPIKMESFIPLSKEDAHVQ